MEKLKDFKHTKKYRIKILRSEAEYKRFIKVLKFCNIKSYHAFETTYEIYHSSTDDYENLINIIFESDRFMKYLL